MEASELQSNASVANEARSNLDTCAPEETLPSRAPVEPAALASSPDAASVADDSRHRFGGPAARASEPCAPQEQPWVPGSGEQSSQQQAELAAGVSVADNGTVGGVEGAAGGSTMDWKASQQVARPLEQAAAVPNEPAVPAGPEIDMAEASGQGEDAAAPAPQQQAQAQSVENSGSEAEAGAGGSGPGKGKEGTAMDEEAERRKRKREQWEAEQAAKHTWDLHRRVADISTDLEVLTREVARLKREMGDQPPLTRLAEQERAAIEANRAKRLAEVVRTSCKKAVLHITAHKWCWPFNHPVDITVYKDYLDAVKTPMDFSMVKKKIEQGHYHSPDDFLEDVVLIFNNARTYNKPGSDVYVMANTIQEKFEDKYATLVTPRVNEVLAWSQAEAEEARRRHAGAMGRKDDWEALEQRCAVLLKYIDEVAACIGDAKSAAAALCKPVSREDKDYFEMVMALILKDHPGLQPTDDIGLDIDALDALTLRQLQSFVNACEGQRKAHGGAKANSRVAWPGLVIGAGIKALPKKPKTSKQPLLQEEQQQQDDDQPGEASPAVKQEPSPAGISGVLAPSASGDGPAGAVPPAGPAAMSPRAPGRSQPAAAAADISQGKAQHQRSPSPLLLSAQVQQQQQGRSVGHPMTLRGTPPPQAASPAPTAVKELAMLLPPPQRATPPPAAGKVPAQKQLARQQQEAVARQASIASNSSLLPAFPVPLSREGSVTGPSPLHPFFLQIPQNPAAASAMALALQMMQQQQQHQQQFLQQHQLAAAAAAAAALAATGRPPVTGTAAVPAAGVIKPPGGPAGGSPPAPAAGVVPQRPGSGSPPGVAQKAVPGIAAAMPMPAAALEGIAAQLRLPPTMAAQMLAVAAAAAAGPSGAGGPSPGAAMLGGVPPFSAGAVAQQAQQAQILSQMHQLLTRVGAVSGPASPGMLLQQQPQQRRTAVVHAAAPTVPPAPPAQQAQQQQELPQGNVETSQAVQPTSTESAEQPTGAARQQPSPSGGPASTTSLSPSPAVAPSNVAAAPVDGSSTGTAAGTEDPSSGGRQGPAATEPGTGPLSKDGSAG